jgi:hypothetical protein
MPFTGLTKFGGAFLSKFECFICNLVMCWIGKIGPYCNLVMCWISNVLGAGAYLQLLIALLAIPLSVSFPINLHLEVFLYIKAVWLARWLDYPRYFYFVWTVQLLLLPMLTMRSI